MFGLKYWPILAIVSGVMSIVPIFGSILSSVPVVMIGLTQDFWTALWVLLWIIGIHQIEANLLNPKIIGVAAKIHPVLVVLSLIVGEHFFGLWGALLARAGAVDRCRAFSTTSASNRCRTCRRTAWFPRAWRREPESDSHGQRSEKGPNAPRRAPTTRAHRPSVPGSPSPAPGCRNPSTQIKQLMGRLAIPRRGGGWVLCRLDRRVRVLDDVEVRSCSALPTVITLLAVGLFVFAMTQAKKARGVASILGKVETDEDRKAALAELETVGKKNDTAAIFAKAQLELQEDPKQALATLERIDLGKVMASGRGRGARPARDDPPHAGRRERGSRPSSTASISASPGRAHARHAARPWCAEAWARTGEAKKALETLEPVRPRGRRVRAAPPAALPRARLRLRVRRTTCNGMKRVLKKLSAIDAAPARRLHGEAHASAPAEGSEEAARAKRAGAAQDDGSEEVGRSRLLAERAALQAEASIQRTRRPIRAPARRGCRRRLASVWRIDRLYPRARRSDRRGRRPVGGHRRASPQRSWSRRTKPCGRRKRFFSLLTRVRVLPLTIPMS